MRFTGTTLPKQSARKVTLLELVETAERRLSNHLEAQGKGALSHLVPKHLCRSGAQQNHLGSSRKLGFPGPTPSLSLQLGVGPANLGF